MKINIISKTLLTAAVLAGFTQINAQQKSPGINISLMDKTVSPRDDFSNLLTVPG